MRITTTCRPLLSTLVSLALAAVTAAPAGAAVEDPGGPLVYVVVVDGLDGDKVDAGRAPFVSSLLAGQGARATYFKESRSVFVAETNPNHTAMATGAFGESSGIPGNAFALYGTLKDEAGEPSLKGDTGVEAGDSCVINGPIDESRPPSETSGESPGCLLAETFFQTVQRATDRDRVVTAGIFGKPKLARIFAGRRLMATRYDADYLWTPCPDFPASGDSPPYCDPDAVARPTDSYALDDSTVMDELMRTVREGVAGDGRTFARPPAGRALRPQLTLVNLPNADAVGHFTGTGPAYDQVIAEADADVQRFVAQQKSLGLWERTTMILLSDHGMDTTLGRTMLGRRFTAAGIPSSAYTIVQNGSAALVYLGNRTAPKADRDTLLKRMRAAALDASPGAKLTGGNAALEALYREPNAADGGDANTLGKVHPEFRVAGSRGGDLVLNAAPGSAFSEGSTGNPLPGNHGGGQTRDNFFAVIGGSPAIRQGTVGGTALPPLFDDAGTNRTSSETADVAATAMRALGRVAPAQSRGRFLTEAFDAAQLPPISAAGALKGAIAATPGTVPLDGGTVARARVRLLNPRVRAKGGRIVLRFTCAGKAGQRCSTTVNLRRGSPNTGGVRTVARGKVSVKVGASVRVGLRLDRRTRLTLVRNGRVRGRIARRTIVVLRAR